MCKPKTVEQNCAKSLVGKVCTFNVRGFKDENKQLNLVNDMDIRAIPVCAIQESKLCDTDVIQIKSDRGTIYNLYTSACDNKYHGVGFIVHNSHNVKFNPVNNRICYITIINSGEKTHIINAYAPTLPNSEKNPIVRETFYEELQSVFELFNKRDIIFVCGDFNAKTGSEYEKYPDVMGRFGRGKANSNGEYLLEFAKNNHLILTNTTFQHKMSHITTWTANFNHTKTNKPVRNQIDYILINKQHRYIVNDSRAYNNLYTSSDHKPVIASLTKKWFGKPNNDEKKEKPINVEKLRIPDNTHAYRELVADKINNFNNDAEPQEMWTEIVDVCRTSAREVVGVKSKDKIPDNPRDIKIKELSEKQKRLGKEKEASQDNEMRKKLQKERNQIMKEIHDEVRFREEEKILEDIREIEEAKDDSNRMYKAVRKSVRKKKQKLVIKTKEGLTCDAEEANKEITNFFKEMFHKDNTIDNFAEPKPFDPPLSLAEVKKAVKSLKYNKSAGIDNLTSEELKMGPDELLQSITVLINKISSTGKYPEVLNHGILVPLQKPGKPKGPVGNLRPVILSTLLRKVIAICMLNRIAHKLYGEANIPVTQAAYRPGRSTTEHVLSLKLLIEKALSADNYEIIILLKDLTKAFDNVNRSKLLNILKSILNPDELHMIYILLNNTKLQIRYDGELGETFTSDVGVPQGDGLSPILFTLYLAKSLGPTSKYLQQTLSDHCYASATHIPEKAKQKLQKRQTTDHTYSIQPSTSFEDPDQLFTAPEPDKPPLSTHISDHNYSLKPPSFNLQQQYADDTCWASTDGDKIEHIMNTVSEKFQNFNLSCNPTKDELYHITRTGSEEWKECKYLGSYFDTLTDIKSRKSKAMTAFTQYSHILTNTNLSLAIRNRLFNAYIRSIFLYNSELWSTNKKINNIIDTFQRRLYRKILQIKYPQVIRNTEVYRIFKEIPWSELIKQRRIKWIGHLHRLPEDAPVRVALSEATSPYKKVRGGQVTTYIKSVNSDLKDINFPPVNSSELIEACSDRNQFRKEVRSRQQCVEQLR